MSKKEEKSFRCARCEKLALKKGKDWKRLECESCHEYMCRECALQCWSCDKCRCDRPEERGGAKGDTCVMYNCEKDQCNRPCCVDCSDYCDVCEEPHCIPCKEKKTCQTSEEDKSDESDEHDSDEGDTATRKKRVKTEAITATNKKPKNEAKQEKTLLALPRYIVTHCMQRDYVSDDCEVEVWRLRTQDPAAQFPSLNRKQQAKVTKFFQELQTRDLNEFLTLWDNEDFDWAGEGGTECGPYGTKGMSEFQYVFETIATRLSPDRSNVERPHWVEADKTEMENEKLSAFDLINGNVAFVRLLE